MPISIYSLLNMSKRRGDLFITPTPTHNFTYQSPYLWNTFRKTLAPTRTDFSVSISSVKKCLTKSLLFAQSKNSLEWHSENFTKFELL